MPTLEAASAAAQGQEPPERHTKGYTNLDDRYGKIGISAVAAAIRHRSRQPNRHETRQTPHDSD